MTNNEVISSEGIEGTLTLPALKLKLSRQGHLEAKLQQMPPLFPGLEAYS